MAEEKPSRHNKPWSEAEKELLRKQVRAGMDQEALAQAHDRTEDAVRNLIDRMGLREDYRAIQRWMDGTMKNKEFVEFMMDSDYYDVTDFSNHRMVQALLSDKNSTVPDWVYRVLVVNTIGIGLVLIAVIALMVTGV